MAQPADPLHIFHALDTGLAAAVAAAAPSTVHVSRGHTGGTGIVWEDDLVITSSFHTPDRTSVGVASPGDEMTLDKRDAEVIGRHASIALATAQQEASLTRAIDARKLVGQAQGILMERYSLDDRRAFDVLRRYSQSTNTKLNEVARILVSTRRLPSDAARGPATPD